MVGLLITLTLRTSWICYFTPARKITLEVTAIHTLDSLLDQASIEQDPNARLKMYQDAEQIVVQDAAMLPLFFGRNYVLVKPYVKDYVLSPLGYPLLNKVSIQK